MTLPRLIRKILNLIRILRIFYLHSFIAMIKTFLGRTRQCQAEWARLTFDYLKVKIVELIGNKPLKEGKLMVYANHRSQADFFLHNVLLNYQTNFLSRMAVLVASPAFAVSYKTVWFFNRGQRTQPEKFNEWLDYKFGRSPRPALLVYPEGHRMQGYHKADPMMLKTGMFKYAYRRQIPAQILMTFGNEEIFDEKRLHIAFNESVFYRLSQVIEPRDFDTENHYIAYVRTRFCQFFDETYEQYVQMKQGGQGREQQNALTLEQPERMMKV